MIAMLSISVGLVWLLLMAMVIRSELINEIRVSFLCDPELWPTAYCALPSYETMLYHPKYYLLWTKSHWMAWVERQT